MLSRTTRGGSAAEPGSAVVTSAKEASRRRFTDDSLLIRRRRGSRREASRGSGAEPVTPPRPATRTSFTTTASMSGLRVGIAGFELVHLLRERHVFGHRHPMLF